MDADEFSCSICLQTCTDAVEAPCCTQLFCEHCVASLKQCPVCRKSPFQVIPNTALRRMINNLKMECTNCKVVLQRREELDHSFICPGKTHQCPAPDCEYSGVTEEFGLHILKCHRGHFFKNIKSIFEEAEVDMSDKKVLKNDQGRAVRFSERSGKPYCSGPMHLCGCRHLYSTSPCYNEICGPNSGCNCTSCMKLDIKIKGLPPGVLVNNIGRVAVRDENGHFFCRTSSGGNPICGTNGLGCDSCKKLDFATNKDYGVYKDLTYG